MLTPQAVLLVGTGDLVVGFCKSTFKKYRKFRIRQCIDWLGGDCFWTLKYQKQPPVIVFSRDVFLLQEQKMQSDSFDVINDLE